VRLGLRTNNRSLVRPEGRGREQPTWRSTVSLPPRKRRPFVGHGSAEHDGNAGRTAVGGGAANIIRARNYYVVTDGVTGAKRLVMRVFSHFVSLVYKARARLFVTAAGRSSRYRVRPVTFVERVFTDTHRGETFIDDDVRSPRNRDGPCRALIVI